MELRPFRHVVIDNYVSREMTRAASVSWPDERWPHWHRYAGREGVKYATKDADRLPPACKSIVARMLELPLSTVLCVDDAFPDYDLSGAGMHSIPPGGSLPVHLDSSHNPVTGWGRAASAVLWLDDWRPEWGGQLRLWDAVGKRVVKTIDPAPGRLVIFATGQESWHDVAPVAADAPHHRRSLAVFFWTETAAETTRPRAEFAQ
jgi:hypothetical protein